MVHKIGKSGNWHWTKPGGFYLEGPSHSQLLTEAKSFLWRALPNHIGFPNYVHAEQHVFGNTKLKEGPCESDMS